MTYTFRACCFPSIYYGPVYRIYIYTPEIVKITSGNVTPATTHLACAIVLKAGRVISFIIELIQKKKTNKKLTRLSQKLLPKIAKKRNSRRVN